MFWSLILEPGKRYSSTVNESFHLSMATLDVKTCKNDNEIHPVAVEVDGEELLLCNLLKTSIPHASLDLMFQKGNEITFFTKGKATVHLTGYYLEEEMTDDEDDYSDLEEEEENESFSDLVQNAKKASGQLKLEGKSKNADKQNANKRKLEPVEAISKKKPKGGKVESDDDDDEDDSDDLSGDLDDSKLGQLVDSINNEDDSSDENDEDDSDLDDEEDNSDDSEGEDEVDDEDDDEDDDDSDSEDETEADQKPNKKEVKTPVPNKLKTPLSNKKQNKNELTNGTTPQSSKKDKNKNQANQQTPKQAGLKTPNKDGQKTPNKKGESTPQSQKKQTLNGGVVVEELRPGSGQAAKYGKPVQVYYTGRLKNNNRVFDQTNQGPGFKFRLGNGEVIKGWDVALNGMKVGGKRRITIPPAMAYGSKGSPPQIPPNSWLVFDVELKSVG